MINLWQVPNPPKWFHAGPTSPREKGTVRHAAAATCPPPAASRLTLCHASTITSSPDDSW